MPRIQSVVPPVARKRGGRPLFMAEYVGSCGGSLRGSGGRVIGGLVGVSSSYIRCSGLRFRGSERSRVASNYTHIKCVQALYLEARCPPGHRKLLHISCEYSSRRSSSVSSLLLQDLHSPYFLKFNGDFTTTETAQERSVKRLSNARAHCQETLLKSGLAKFCF